MIAWYGTRKSFAKIETYIVPSGGLKPAPQSHQLLDRMAEARKRTLTS